MATIENFILRFKTEGAGAIKTLSNDLAALGQSVNPLGGSFDALLGRLGPIGIAAGAAAGAFAALGMRAINLSDELDDLSNTTGISASVLNSLKGQMIEAGGNTESMAKAVIKLGVATGEAMSGNEKYQKSFKDLGVYVRDSSGKLRDSNDILNDVLVRLAAIPDQANRMALAYSLLGKEAAKIDWSAITPPQVDPAFEANQKQLAALRTEIDKLKKSFDDKIINFFGDWAKTLNEGGIGAGLAKLIEEIGKFVGYMLNIPTNAVASAWNALVPDSLAIKKPFGMGDGLISMAKDAEKARLKWQEEEKKRKDAQTKALQDQRPAGKVKATTGDYGGPSEQVIKAAKENEARIKQSYAERDKFNELTVFDEIANIKLTKEADIQKAIAEIKARERLNGAQIDNEIIAKRAELEAKAAFDIRKIRDGITKQLDEQIKTMSRATEERQNAFDIEQKFVRAGAGQLGLQQQLLEIQKRKTDAIEAARKAAEKDPSQGDKAIAKIEENAKKEEAIAQQRYQWSRDFSTGWQKAFGEYLDNATNAATQAEQMFTAMTNGMNSALDNFVETGKFSFSDLTNSIIKDIIKIQLRASVANLFGATSSFLGFKIPGIGGKAIGGPVMANTPYMIGERGPELFIPAGAGNIVPNNKLGQGNAGSPINISYNIQAVDAISFKQLVARDPGFMYAVTEQGRKSIPQTSR
jgi:lambda family phage tail tape measure protein